MPFTHEKLGENALLLRFGARIDAVLNARVHAACARLRSAAIEAVIFAGWALSTTPWMALAFRSLNGFILGHTGVMPAVQSSTHPKQRLALAGGTGWAGPLPAWTSPSTPMCSAGLMA